MYVHENDRREYVRDDGHGHENVCVHACVLCAYGYEHVHVRDHDVHVRARGGDHGHGGDDQSPQRFHGLFHRVPYVHRSRFPKCYFLRYGLHEDDSRRAK